MTDDAQNDPPAEPSARPGTALTALVVLPLPAIWSFIAATDSSGTDWSIFFQAFALFTAPSVALGALVGVITPALRGDAHRLIVTLLICLALLAGALIRSIEATFFFGVGAALLIVANMPTYWLGLEIGRSLRKSRPRTRRG